jgi:hypothetical protein
MKEYKQQYIDRNIINNLDIEKQNVINRALIRANELIDNRNKKGKIMKDEEKDELIKMIENEFIEMFKTICSQNPKIK